MNEDRPAASRASITSLRRAAVSFPPGTKFLVVDGVPVAYGPAGAFAFDGAATFDGKVPRPFPAKAALRNGSVISAAAFDRLRGHWGQLLCDNLNRNVRNNVPTS